MIGADNQQERLDLGWIVGFVDGEGCFYVGINKDPRRNNRWNVLPEFRVVQHKSDEQILHRIRNFFGFGNITVNHGDRKEWRVRGLQDLNKLVKFFSRNSLKTKKQKSFLIFKEIVEMMNKKQHLTKIGLRKIAFLTSKMNRRVKPRYLKSSETLRPTSKR